MHLLIDLGNSRLKWAQCAPGTWLTGSAPYRERDIGELLDELWAPFAEPEAVSMVSVAAPDVAGALAYWTQDRWGISPKVLSAAAEQRGVVNRYEPPESLGADRWAALVAARELTQGACVVIDCGTAITIDAMSGTGEFLGGVILPGLELMRRALATGTAAIGRSEAEGANCIARNTADAVAAGAFFGAVGAIERCVQEQRRTLGEVIDVFITGGDAPRVLPKLSCTTQHVPDLVLKGLARIVGAEEL